MQVRIPKLHLVAFCHLRWVVALTCPEANSGSTGARAGTIFTPGAPGAILLDLIWVFPHAVTFVAPLQRTAERKSKPNAKAMFLKQQMIIQREHLNTIYGQMRSEFFNIQ